MQAAETARSAGRSTGDLTAYDLYLRAYAMVWSSGARIHEALVGSVAGGRTSRATAALFGVSVASVVKWSQRWRASGSAAAKQMGGWKQLMLLSEREWLLARIAEKPDLTLRALVAELCERGTPASYGAVMRYGTWR